MYSQQKGFWPLLTKLAGMIILVYGIAAGLTALVEQIIESLDKNYPLIVILIASIAALLVLGIPVWVGLVLVNLFPAIRVTQEGLKYKALSFFGGLITWGEIDDVLILSNKFVVVSFVKPGFFLFNGTYFNKLCGLLIKHEGTVLFLSPGIADEADILLEIYKNSSIKQPKFIGK